MSPNTNPSLLSWYQQLQQLAHKLVASIADPHTGTQADKRSLPAKLNNADSITIRQVINPTRKLCLFQPSTRAGLTKLSLYS